MMFLVLYMFLSINIISSTDIKFDMNREYFYHGKDLFCARLQCTENTREDTQISALVNMSVYRISEPEGKILVASIAESDSKLQDYKRTGTRVEGIISKTFSELEIFFSNNSDCNDDIFLCEIHYVNTTGSIDRIGKQTESFPRKSRDTFLMMNLKAKTSDYVKSVDTMADFLKSFEDSDRLKGADMTMSLQMSHSGADKFITDRNFDSSDNNYKQINSSVFDDKMLNDKIKNLTLDVNKTLQMMENKLSSKITLNKNSLAVLNESMQTMLDNKQKQIEQLSIGLNEIETNIKKSGGDKFSTDKSFRPTHTELINIFEQISFVIFDDLLKEYMKNLTLDVNKALQIMENKVNSKLQLNINSLVVLQDSIQRKLANSHNQTEQLGIRLNEMENKSKKIITQENINSTFQLVAGFSKTLQGFIEEYYVNPMHLKLTKQCVRNDNSSLQEQTAFKVAKRKLALCDTKTDGGGWIVIQRRVAGDVSFTRNWSSYKNGFGFLAGDYWLGNDIISNLTQNGYSELRFDMKYKGKSYYMVYSNVTLGNEADLYRIKFTYKTGNTTDNFSKHNGMAFSTLDRDNDKSSSNCADSYKSGWWYTSCHYVNVNGVWASKARGEGIIWDSITDNIDSLEQVEMKLRRP
ncbi:angiopoietin-4-like [Physella acuta]|uniref:angiopoietin-4-like n=1 Tax=Physella acuta TaxID=109671 RepID=UPI0027DBCC6D|nr:angiopoietin-4-like [Physella acuta]